MFILFILTLFYMGFWRYVDTWGGQIDPPLLKARKMIQTWSKCTANVLLVDSTA